MVTLFHKLLYLNKGHYRSLIAMIFLFLFVSSLEVFGTGIIGPFIAIATNPKLIDNNVWLNTIYVKFNFASPQQFLMALGIVLIVAFCAKSFLSFCAQRAVFQFGYNLKSELSCKLMKAYLSAPYSFHLNINSASLIQDIISTTDNVCIGVMMSVLTSISNVVVSLALMILLVQTNAIALLLITTILLVMLVLVKWMKRRLTQWTQDGWESAGAMIRILHHSLGGVKEIRVIGCESYFQQQMEEQSQKFAFNTSRSQSYGNLPRYALEVFTIAFLVVFAIIFINIDGEQQNFSAILGIFALASLRLLPATGNLVSGLNVIRANTFAVDKLYFDLQNLEKEHLIGNDNDLDRLPDGYSAAKSEIMPFNSKVTIEDLIFTYPNSQQQALNKISLTIEKGQSIGIIGKSGSGKTTLVDTILGLFQPQHGDIKVDGVSVYKNLRAWQNILGYVPQSIFLIDDTLERNIAFGVPDGLIDRSRLQTAIEMSQLADVVEKLPKGIHTVVGERGVLLSGGQRQRVGIARVLYHQREILVFDEATAALDNETEHSVTEAINALSGNNTTIVIAHRLSTLKHCDRIYQIEEGRVVRAGSYQEIVLGH